MLTENLSEFDLNDPEQFAEASKSVASHIADTFGSDFVRSDGDKVFVTVDVLSTFAQADVVNGIEAGVTGQTDLAITLFKTAVTLNAIVDEAKARA